MKTETKGKSTRRMIIAKSLDLINEKGIVDFRIELLAEELQLSPGNITYHFARKDELGQWLWSEFCHELDMLQTLFTTALDVKQTFLVFRAIATLVYKYRGIVIYWGGDRESGGLGSFSERMNRLCDLTLRELEANGYLKPNLTKSQLDLCKKIVLIEMRYWINREYMAGETDIAEKINYNALTTLYALYNLFSEEGIKEFDGIKNRLENESIDIPKTETQDTAPLTT